MTYLKATLAALALATSTAAIAAPVIAQEAGITVRSIRVMGADPEALAVFYSKAFGMSETRRPANSATFKEIVLNSGSTPELAKKATSTPIVIATRRANEPKAGGMAALILDVPDMDKAIAAVVAAGGKGGKANKSGEGLTYAFVTDPEGNQIELLLR
jgi:predicted enzyme related to lactoylglutathione lyase